MLIIVNKDEITKNGFLFDCPKILFRERSYTQNTNVQKVYQKDLYLSKNGLKTEINRDKG